MEPIARIELFLAKITGEDVELPVPQTRAELFLAKIAGESVELPAPQSRLELFLAKIAGQDVELPEPQARVELYLAAIAGEAVDPPEDYASRLEYYLGKWNGNLPSEYKRVLGFTMDNNVYWEITDFPLYGSDTLRFSFEATAACNVLGAYSGSASGNNYSLYVSSSGNYLRYKNGAFNSGINFDTRYDVEITPTGSHGMKTDSTWTEQTFTTPTNFIIGTTTLTGSSAKMKGSLYGSIEVVGRAKFVPCERLSDGVLGYYDAYSETFYTPTGTPPTVIE